MKFENLSSMMETTKVISLPQKKYYRQRAHSNPVADHCIDYPIKPELFNWSSLFPDSNSPVEFLDVGCGYGGLLVTLSPMFPSTNILGLEIRVKVSDYVIDRIRALRSQNPQQYKNIACLRTNAMKYLPNYFRKGQLKKMFFLYPDPHFKRAKHKWRIINKFLLSEYAYVLSENALVYTITDVLELHNWMEEKLSEHPLFEKVSEKEQNSDPIVSKLYDCTEEGQKVTRNNGEKYMSVYRRIIEK